MTEITLCKLEAALIKNKPLLHPIAIRILYVLQKGFSGSLRELTRSIDEKYPQTTKHHLARLRSFGYIEPHFSEMILTKKGVKALENVASFLTK